MISYIKAFFNKEQAIIKNDTGFQVGIATLNRAKKIFKFKGGVYNIVRDSSFYHFKSGLIFNITYYFYINNNPDPICLNKKDLKPKINASIYNEMLESTVLLKLNRVAGRTPIDFLKNLTITQIILIIGVLFIAYSYLTTGSIL